MSRTPARKKRGNQISQKRSVSNYSLFNAANGDGGREISRGAVRIAFYVFFREGRNRAAIGEEESCKKEAEI